MPIYHTVYNLYTVGLSSEQLTRNTFWLIYQKTGLSAFVLVSGMAFILSTAKGIKWDRIGRRAFKLGAIAALISLTTWVIFPDKFIRFGVLHFFTVTLLLAPVFRRWKFWAAVPGILILLVFFKFGYAGAINEAWLYPTGLMSGRPPSLDYIPLTPWFGVFLLGMAIGHILPAVSTGAPARWQLPIIWLGQHSLAFYVVHQILVYGVLSGIAWSLAWFSN